MAVVAINPYIYFPAITTNSVSSYAIDAAGEKCAWVFMQPDSDTLVGCAFGINNVATAETLKVSVQGVNASGEPDGSILSSGNAYATLTPSVSVYEATFVSSASLTGGTAYAIVVEFDSTTGSVTLYQGGSQGAGTQRSVGCNCAGSSYCTTYISSWSTSTTLLPCLSLKYDDGYHYNPTLVYPWSTATTVSWNNGSTPDERGMVFTAPANLRVRGLWANIDSNTQTYDLCLYSGTTLLNSVSGVYQADSNPTVSMFLFDDDGYYDLTKDSVYRIVIKPTAASNIGTYTLLTSRHLASISDTRKVLGWAGWQYTSRTDGGSWTDDDTYSGMIVGAVVSGIDVTSSSGGGSIIGSSIISPSL